ncbi:hypothetical protein MLD38_017155 [Melastoma candidum]|uniref:Uncharacterized protein n=1 Tax=Melastoma candidum TaxID=119954 RepID=A0ACB9QQ94_9MYRT|nr:hypothetical protein MLD38_017155 [Melastoma candidum]
MSCGIWPTRCHLEGSARAGWGSTTESSPLTRSATTRWLLVQVTRLGTNRTAAAEVGLRPRLPWPSPHRPGGRRGRLRNLPHKDGVSK